MFATDLFMAGCLLVGAIVAVIFVLVARERERARRQNRHADRAIAAIYAGKQAARVPRQSGYRRPRSPVG